MVGYEYVRERMFHSPILTTYKRNRKALAREAVRQITGKLENEEFTSPKGKLICGNSCPCGISSDNLKNEIEDIRIRKDYDFLNLVCQFELKLTECRTMEEFIKTCREFRFMIRNADDIRLCLSENRYYDNEVPSDNLISYSIIKERPSVHFRKSRFSSLFSESSPSVYYFSPVFIPGRVMGYSVVEYDHPDAYDHVYRNWLKNISSGLVTLSMKNNIRYLLECQNLSDVQDTFTGLNNEKGFKAALTALDHDEEPQYHIIFLQIGILCDSLNISDQKKQSDAVVAAAETVRKIFSSNPPKKSDCASEMIWFLEVTYRKLPEAGYGLSQL